MDRATAKLPEDKVNADPMLPAPYRVASVHRETGTTVTLELAPRSTETEFVFKPGQFNMLYAFGLGEVAISMSGDASAPLPIVHTIHRAGLVTRAICALEPGAEIGVRGPYGRPWPVEQAQGADVLVVAGGIGLAPLRPLIYHLIANRSHYGRIVLLYGSRSPRNLLYREELTHWRGRFDMDVHVTVDHATADWFGRVGVVTTLIQRASFDPDHTVAMICGPEVMMRFCVRQLEAEGVPPTSIYLSMERNMTCAVGFCGHCQFGPEFVCKDGPVFSCAEIEPFLQVREV